MLLNIYLNLMMIVKGYFFEREIVNYRNWVNGFKDFFYIGFCLILFVFKKRVNNILNGWRCC